MKGCQSGPIFRSSLSSKIPESAMQNAQNIEIIWQLYCYFSKLCYTKDVSLCKARLVELGIYNFEKGMSVLRRYHGWNED